MLIAVIGDLGTGKTLFLVLVAFSSKKEVWANFKIDLDQYFHLDVMDLIDQNLQDKNILIDEAYTWLESRVSSSFLNRYISYIIFQSRKRTVDVYTTEQLFHSVDRRFRELVNKIISCERVPNEYRNKDQWDFRYNIYDCYTEDITSFILPYEKAKDYFPLYNTYQIIEPFNKDHLDFQIRKEQPKEQYKKIEEIAKTLRKEIDGKTITHSKLKMLMLKKGYKLDYETLVYAYLKDLED